MRSSRGPRDNDDDGYGDDNDMAQHAEPPADTDNEDFEPVTGGYLFVAVTEGDGAAGANAPSSLTLTEPLAVRSTHFSLSIPPERIPPGQIYMLGTPGTPACEVVQVDTARGTPGRPRSIRRALYGTVVTAHPVGTPVTAISVERVDDWKRWDQRDS